MAVVLAVLFLVFPADGPSTSGTSRRICSCAAPICSTPTTTSRAIPMFACGPESAHALRRARTKGRTAASGLAGGAAIRHSHRFRAGPRRSPSCGSAGSCASTSGLDAAPSRERRRRGSPSVRGVPSVSPFAGPVWPLSRLASRVEPFGGRTAGGSALARGRGACRPGIESMVAGAVRRIRAVFGA